MEWMYYSHLPAQHAPYRQTRQVRNAGERVGSTKLSPLYQVKLGVLGWPRLLSRSQVR